MPTEGVERSRVAAVEATDTVLAYDHVFGCGVGERIVGGERTGEPCLVVYVDRKLPREALRRDQLLPRSIETSEGAVLVDVVERTAPSFGVDSAQYRPLVGGSRISASATTGSGTLGAVMYDRTDAETVLLTCNHVLTPAGERGYVPANTRVSQPFLGMVVGDTKRIVPWLPPPLGAPGANLQARVDAGIVSIDATVQSRFQVIALGKHPFVPLPPSIGLEVQKRGWVTEVTSGTIEEIDVTVVITDFNGQKARIGGPGSGFSVRSAPDDLFFQRGDSGSLVVDADGGAARGLMFAGDFSNAGVSWGCQLSAIMEELQLETPCTGSLNEAFRRALLRRRLMRSIAFVDAPLISTLEANLSRFRVRYLTRSADGTSGAELERILRHLSYELSEGLHSDDDFAGLMDAAIGDWLVQPTVYDLLEYRLPDDFEQRLGSALERLREVHPDAEGLDRLLEPFAGAGGMSMREALARSASAARAAS